MNVHEFHKRVILDEVFGGAGMYPLSIILPETDVDTENAKVIHEYRGVHFVCTDALLSLIQPKATRLEIHFDKDGNRLRTPFDPKRAFSFYSAEIGYWCELLVEGRVLPLEHCDQPYVYRDKQFEEFERIAMKFPAYEAMVKGEKWNELIKPPDYLILQLDAALLRLRKMLV